MNGMPVGGISIFVNLIVVGVRGLRLWLFPSYETRTLKTRDMPLTSLGIFASMAVFILVCATVILDESVTSSVSNYQLVEDVSQNKPIVVPCIFEDENCVIQSSNISMLTTF